MYPKNIHVVLHEQQSGLCFYCRLPMVLIQERDHPKRACTVEHRVPRSRGGANGRGNLVGACGECNSIKGNLTDAEFIHYQALANGDKARLIALCRAGQLSEAKLIGRIHAGIDTYQRWRTRRESQLDRAWENIMRAPNAAVAQMAEAQV